MHATRLKYQAPHHIALCELDMQQFLYKQNKKNYKKRPVLKSSKLT